MSFSIIIPARYASTRLPGKPLLDIAGKPMIQHVYERAVQTSAERVIVATDDSRIVNAVSDFGGEVVTTRDDHPSGTDRLAEVTDQLSMKDEQLIVNLQGDEPLLPVEAIEQVASNLKDRAGCGIATLCEMIDSDEEITNPNAVKVVRDKENYALYFSRAAIPCFRDRPVDSWRAEEGLWYRHLGIYAYRVSVLREFVCWPPSDLEKAECLEQQRALYNGVRIHCDNACVSIPPGVDTEDDLQTVRAYFSTAS